MNQSGSHVGQSNLVMEDVDDAPWGKLVIRVINGVEGTLDEVVIAASEMRHVNVGVLEPALLSMGRE